MKYKQKVLDFTNQSQGYKFINSNTEIDQSNILLAWC